MFFCGSLFCQHDKGRHGKEEDRQGSAKQRRPVEQQGKVGDDAACDVVSDTEEDADDEASALLAAAVAAEGEGQCQEHHCRCGQRGEQALPVFEAFLTVVQAVRCHEAGQGVQFAQGFRRTDGGKAFQVCRDRTFRKK